jgi:hypothetical protein
MGCILALAEGDNPKHTRVTREAALNETRWPKILSRFDPGSIASRGGAAVPG